MNVRLGGVSRYGTWVMPKLLLPLVLLSIVFSFSACSSGKKKNMPANRLYEGNAPTIHFNDEPETAGGPLSSS